MNSFIENAVLYICNFTQLLQGLLLTTVNYAFDIAGLSPDTLSHLTNYISKPTDELGTSFIGFYKQLIGSLAFDQFQLLLMKIFILTLFTILIMICGAWHVYGSRVTDRFMYSDIIMKNKQDNNTNKNY